MPFDNQDIIHWNTTGGRQQLKINDYKFITYILRGKVDVRWDTLVSEPEVRDSLLDEDALIDAILQSPQPLPISVDLYFYVLVRRALLENLIDSRSIADYSVLLLKQGLHVAEAFNNDINEGKTFFYVTDCLQKIQEASPEQQFYLRLRLGNQALLETSVFEEHLRFRSGRYGAPNIQFIEAVGGSQYQAAVPHRLAEELKLREVLSMLGSSFPSVRKALKLFGDRFVSFGDPFISGEGLIPGQD